MGKVVARNLATVQKRSKQGKPWYVVIRIGSHRKGWAFATKNAATRHCSRLNAAIAAGELFNTDTCEPISWDSAANGLSTVEVGAELVKKRWPHLRATSRRSLVEGVAHVIAAADPKQDKRADTYRLARIFLSGGTFTFDEETDWIGVDQRAPTMASCDPNALMNTLVLNLDGEPAAVTSTRRRRFVLGQMWRYATGERFQFDTDDASRGTRGKVNKRIQQTRIGTVPEALSVIEQVNIEWAKRAFYLMLYAGLRPAEAVSVRWQDVGKHALTVEDTRPESGALFTDSGEAVDVQPPKWRSDGEVRRVPIVPPLRVLLDQWHTHDFTPPGGNPSEGQDEKGSAASGQGKVATGGGEEVWTAPEWVCTTSAGTPGRVVELSREWPKARAKVADGWHSSRLARAYDLRHTHASLALSAGMPVKELADRLGHAPSMLLDVYSESVPGDEPKWTSVLGDALDSELSTSHLA